MPDAQLDFDGGEGPVQGTGVRRALGLSPAQEEVMRVLGRNGSIRPVEAGLILYAFTEPTEEAQDRRARYASSDGSELLRRLAKRGLVHWVRRGRWEAGPGPEPVQLRRSEGGPTLGASIEASGGICPPPPVVFDLGVIRDSTIRATESFTMFGEALRTGVGPRVSAVSWAIPTIRVALARAMEEKRGG